MARGEALKPLYLGVCRCALSTNNGNGYVLMQAICAEGFELIKYEALSSKGRVSHAFIFGSTPSTVAVVNTTLGSCTHQDSKRAKVESGGQADTAAVSAARDHVPKMWIKQDMARLYGPASKRTEKDGHSDEDSDHNEEK
jgi:hypothetical protein